MSALQHTKLLPLFCAVLLAVFSPFATLANVGVFDGSGAALTLGGSDTIQMVSEVVEITFTPADGPVTGDYRHRDKAHYSCRFILKNLSDKTVTAQVGFPLFAESKGRTREEPAELQKRIEHYAFSASGGDTRYAVRYQSADANDQYQSLFVWDMTFAPGERTELEVRYAVHGYNGLGTTLRPDADAGKEYAKSYLRDMELAVVQSYPYVTQTAGSWAGLVEEAQFIVSSTAFEQHLRKRGAFDTNTNRKAPRTPEEREEQQREARILRAFNNGTFYTSVQPGNWQQSTDGQTLTWIEAPFTRHQDFEVTYVFSTMPATAEGFRHLLDQLEKSYAEKSMDLFAQIALDPANTSFITELGMNLMAGDHSKAPPFSDADRKNIADAVLEFYGITTGNPAIEDYLGRQSWYATREQRTIDEKLKAELMRWHTIGKK